MHELQGNIEPNELLELLVASVEDHHTIENDTAKTEKLLCGRKYWVM
jgi:hypothetical protein